MEILPESTSNSSAEHVSSSGTLSSIKNLDDAYTIGDQFINDKSIKDEQGKLNAESEVVSMVMVPIHQASSLIPPLYTPIIDLSLPKPASSTKAPIFTATTTTTTTNLLLPPLHHNKARQANTLATTYQAPTKNSLLEKTGDMRTFMHCKGSGRALLISKMIVARYLDFGLELLIPEHMWINEVCNYDISASYGISHWWFNRQKFYIDQHIAESSRKVVRTHMCILSVVSIKAFSHYGYDYLKEITLRRVDYQEYTITEKDFKSFYPSDFEDLNLLLLQGHLNHLYGSNKHQLNLTKPGWDAKGFKYKHDYAIIDSPRAVKFSVGNNERKIMRFNEIYKFSDGTLTNIIEALKFRVKEYKVNRLNSGMNTWF
nr:hypothetical protein [Tanacetum cinerariifolium]